MQRYHIPVGTSEPQDFLLRNNGAAINGTGFTVGIQVSTLENGVATPHAAPTVAWLDQPAGTVRVTGLEAFAVGNYVARFTLTDGTGKVGFCPNGERGDLWVVVPVANP